MICLTEMTLHLFISLTDFNSRSCTCTCNMQCKNLLLLRLLQISFKMFSSCHVTVLHFINRTIFNSCESSYVDLSHNSFQFHLKIPFLRRISKCRFLPMSRLEAFESFSEMLTSCLKRTPMNASYTRIVRCQLTFLDKKKQLGNGIICHTCVRLDHELSHLSKSGAVLTS